MRRTVLSDSVGGEALAAIWLDTERNQAITEASVPRRCHPCYAK
jgi:hypothetical protein